MGICGSNAKVAITPKDLTGEKVFTSHQAHVIVPLKENNSICSKNTQPKDVGQGNKNHYQIIGFIQPQDVQNNCFNRNTCDKASNNIIQHVQCPQVNDKRELAFKKGHMVDRGSYGEVFQSLDVNTGQLYAIKTIKKLKPKAELDEEVKQLQVEIEQFHNLQHQNIVKFIACELDEDEHGINIISEYISGGSIRCMLEKFGKFNENVVSIYTKQVLLGLQYLHQNNVLHQDIKGGNILIDTDGTIKLTDFGTLRAHKQDSIMQIKSSLSSLPLWTPPELLTGTTQQGRYSDVWSLGCLVIEMLTGLPPYAELHGSDAEKIRQHIIDRNRPTFPPNLSEACQEFLNQTLQIDPFKRSTVDELLELQFVKDREPVGSIGDQTSPNYMKTAFYYSQSSLGIVAGGGIIDSQQLSQIGSSTASQAYFIGEHMINQTSSRIFASRNEIPLQGKSSQKMIKNQKDEQQGGNKLVKKGKHSKKETRREARGEYQQQLISQLKESQQDAENQHSISSRSLSSVQYSSGIRGQPHQLEDESALVQAQKDVEDEILELIKNKKKKKAQEIIGNKNQSDNVQGQQVLLAPQLNDTSMLNKGNNNLCQNNQNYQRDLQIQVVFNNPKDFFKPLQPEETIESNEIHLKKFCNDIQNNTEEYDGTQNILEQPLKEQENDYEDDDEEDGDDYGDGDDNNINHGSKLVIEEIGEQQNIKSLKEDQINKINKQNITNSDKSERQSGETNDYRSQNQLNFESTLKKKEKQLFEEDQEEQEKQKINLLTEQGMEDCNMIRQDHNNYLSNLNQGKQENTQIQNIITELQFGDDNLLMMYNDPTSTRTYMSINEQLQGNDQEQELYNYALEVVDIS